MSHTQRGCHVYHGMDNYGWVGGGGYELITSETNFYVAC